MKKLIGLICLFLICSSTAYSAQKFKALDKDSGQISCPLYKNRLLTSLQRLSEYDYADKLKNKKFKFNDYKYLLALYNRHELPFLENETLYFEADLKISKEQFDLIKQSRFIKVDSLFFKFETDRLVFPDSAFLITMDEENSVLKIEMPLNYYQACLNSFTVQVTFMRGEDFLSLNFLVDKYAYDLANLNVI